MKRLEIKETNNTPHILMDAESNVFMVEGKSFPEDSKEFYRPLTEWLNDYVAATGKEFKFHFNLFYISSSSIISVKQILQKVMEIKQGGANVVVVWHYDEDDDDIRKTGEDYERLTKLPFQYLVNQE